MNGVMGIANAERAINYIRIITEFISQPEWQAVVPVFSIINEALVPTIGKSQMTSLLVLSLSLNALFADLFATQLPPHAQHDSQYHWLWRRPRTLHCYPRRFSRSRRLGRLFSGIRPHYARCSPILCLQWGYKYFTDCDWRWSERWGAVAIECVQHLWAAYESKVIQFFFDWER